MIGIGELSKRTGCNIETIRYYEKIGLIPSPSRSDGGHRQYAASHQQRLQLIMRTRQLGFSLQEVQELISLSNNNERTCGDIVETVTKHSLTIRDKIAALQSIEASLQALAHQCQGCCPGTRAPDCTVLKEFA